MIFFPFINGLYHICVKFETVKKVGLMRKATEIYEDRDDDDAPKFGDAECVGTPEYLSPEVILQVRFLHYLCKPLRARRSRAVSSELLGFARANGLSKFER